MKLSLTVLSTLAFSLGATAQNAPFQGFMFNWDRPTLGAHWDQVTRWNTTAESDLVRVDTDDHRQWARDTAGAVKIRGFAAWMYDSNYASAESYSFVGHAEDPANANFPLATAAFTIPNIPMPAGTAGNAYLVTATLNQGVTVSGAGDVFLGMGLPAMVQATQPYDGLWIGQITRTQPGLTIVDEPGPRGQVGAGIFREDYSCFISGGVANYGVPNAQSLSQLTLDVSTDSGMVGGVALAETNQTSLTPSNAPNGTSDFLSGLHPDLQGFNPGRADNIGFGVTHHTGQMAIGSPVFILLAFGPSPLGNQPIGTFSGVDPASSAGNVCIDFTNAATFLTFSRTGFLAGMGEAQLMLTLSPQVRASIAGMPMPFDFWWQGFALDAAATGPGLEVRTTGCVLQHIQ